VPALALSALVVSRVLEEHGSGDTIRIWQIEMLCARPLWWMYETMSSEAAKLLACRAAQTTRALLTTQVQAMCKLNQPAVIVKAREVDVQIVQGVLDGARSKYKQTYSSDAPTVTMAENYLPGPPSGGLLAARALCTFWDSAHPADHAAVSSRTVQCNL